MIPFLLNLPYTIVGILFALTLVPTKISWDKKHWAIIVNVKGDWPHFGYLKRWRGATIGHVIILNPHTEDGVLEHELIHVDQYRKYPLIFPLLYEIEFLRKGYRNNKYEIEAYSKAGI